MVIFAALIWGCQMHVDSCFEESKGLPIASWLYMGLNTEEFGFQDNSHDENRTMEDVVVRLKSYSPNTIFQLAVKKTFWTWTDGTYQAERYGLGTYAENETDKFAYKTPLTSYALNPGTGMYDLLETWMHAQYYVLAGLAIIGAYKVRKDRRWDTIVLLFVGFFLFYLIWEIKSRYIFSLYPFMYMFGYMAFRRETDIVKRKGEIKV